MKNKITGLSAAFIMALLSLFGAAISDAQARTVYVPTGRCAAPYRAPVAYQRPLAIHATRVVIAPAVPLLPAMLPCLTGYGGYPYGYGNQACLWQQQQAVLCAERQQLQGDEISLRQTEGNLSNILASRGIPYDDCAVSAAITRAECLSAQGRPNQGISLILQEQSQLNQEIAQLENPGYPGQMYGGQYPIGG